MIYSTMPSLNKNKNNSVNNSLVKDTIRNLAYYIKNILVINNNT